MTARKRIVVATPDVLGAQMAGPAIRAWQFATALSAHHEVTLLTSRTSTLSPGEPFEVVALTAGDDPVASLGPVDVWVIQGAILRTFPTIGASAAAVVVDLYDPFHLESIEQSRDRGEQDRLAIVHNETALLNNAMRRGDLFLTASEKQRDFWLGALATLGRINPLTYDEDPSLRALVGVVPFGVQATPPVADGPALRGVMPGIGPDDRVLLWGGGLYNWFDPQTLVRAVDVVRRTHADVRLVFLGGTHPNPAVTAMRAAVETRELADELGLTGRFVFFNEGWVPYEQRGRYFLEADIGVSTHLAHIETAFSFRTRILDYLWAGLPIVATDGDVFSDVITGRGLGRVVPAGDVHALVGALDELLSDDDVRAACAAASATAATDYHWGSALLPLLEFCVAPRRAPDLLDPIAISHLTRPFEQVRGSLTEPGWRGQVTLAKEYLQQGGMGLVARRLVSRSVKLARGQRY